MMEHCDWSYGPACYVLHILRETNDYGEGIVSKWNGIALLMEY